MGNASTVETPEVADTLDEIKNSFSISLGILYGCHVAFQNSNNLPVEEYIFGHTGWNFLLLFLIAIISARSLFYKGNILAL